MLIAIANDAKSNTVKTFLTHVLQRPSGREHLRVLADNPNFKTTFKDREINGAAQLERIKKSHSPAQVTFAITERGPEPNTAVVGLDTRAIQGIGEDKSGTQTTAHETYHAEDIQSGKSDLEIVRGDHPTSATGPAAKFGETVANEKPDLTEKQARKLLEDLLNAGVK